MEKFISIKENITNKITRKKSKFVANLFYVEDIEQVGKIVKEIKKKHFNARHNCIAFRIINKDGEIIERASDDGEPSGTAGIPMLKILQSNHLGNVLIIVTRYFGGILLGTGGLARAYSDSLIKVIEISKKVEKILGEELKIEISYNDFDKVKYYCEKNDINIINVKYEDNIVCIVEVNKNMSEEIIADFARKEININNYEILNKKFITRVD